MQQEVDHGRGWRNAVRQFLEQNKTYGDLLTHEWLYAAFEIDMPSDGTTYKEAEKAKLQFVGQLDRFRSEMLNEYQMDIRNERGKGWAVVKPGDQTRFAEIDFQSEMKRIGRQVAGRLANVNHSLLSAREKQENADAIARVSNLRAMVRESFPKLPPLLTEE